MSVPTSGRRVQSLPAPFEEGLDLADELHRLGGGALADHAARLVGDQPVLHVVRSGNRWDVGLWLVRPRIWVLAGERHLFVGAWWGGSQRGGREPLEETVSYGDILHHVYNDVTGELLLKLPHGRELPDTRMSPLDGYQMLAQIEKGRENHV